MKNKSKKLFTIHSSLFAQNAGQAMLLTILMLGGAILGASTIAGYLMILKIKASSDITNSTKAIFAAETGIEWELYKCFQCNPDVVCDSGCTALDFQKPSMSNDSQVISSVVRDGAGAPKSIKSIGESAGAYRAFEIEF